MFVERMSDDVVMTTFVKADEAHLYASAAFQLTSILGYFVRRYSQDLEADPTLQIVTLQPEKAFNRSLSRVEHQADIAARRGSPIAAQELGRIAEHMANPDAYTRVTESPSVIIKSRHPLQGSVYLNTAPPTAPE